MILSGKIQTSPVFNFEQLNSYFQYGNCEESQVDSRLQPLQKSIDNVNHCNHSWEELRNGNVLLNNPVRRELQYYKDERLLTLYAFAALDLLKRQDCTPLRNMNFDKLMRSALGDNWKGEFANPQVYLEKQYSRPDLYNILAKTVVSKHPNAYVRAIAESKQNLEGPTHVDAVIIDNHGGRDRHFLFEAKFLSDISCDTTFSIYRNQIARNIDAGLNAVDFQVDRFYFVLVTQAVFKRVSRQRYYSYKIKEYMSQPEKIEHDLPHLRDKLDFRELAQHIGWTTWEDIGTILKGTPPGMLPLEKLQKFFAERMLWPDC